MTKIQTESQLRTVITAEKAVLLCFHSTRSTYSRRTLQTLAKVETEFAATKFCMVDADHQASLPLLREFGVVGLPTILVFRSGVHAGTVLGEHSAKNFEKLLHSLL